MSRALAAFYTPDDDCEHALIANYPDDFTGVAYTDWTFSPAREPQGRAYRVFDFQLIGPEDSIPLAAAAAAFCPADSRRYLFFPTAPPPTGIESTTQSVCWTRFPSPYHDESPKDPLIDRAHPCGTIDVVSGQIIDMAAHFNGTELEVAVLTSEGLLQVFGGAPWTATSWNDSAALGWSERFVGRFPDLAGRRIAISQGAGAGHVFIAGDATITEVWYGPQFDGHDVLATFSNQILDVGNVFTPDGIMHVIVATAGLAWDESILYEVEFRPAETPATTRQIGVTNFHLDALGAYIKPDNAQHIIMSALDADLDGPLALYLSWGSPDLSAFHYGFFPGFPSKVA